jgi:hypothetical protein
MQGNVVFSTFTKGTLQSISLSPSYMWQEWGSALMIDLLYVVCWYLLIT